MKKLILLSLFYCLKQVYSQNVAPIKVFTAPARFAYIDTVLNEFKTNWAFSYAEPFNKYGFARVVYQGYFGYINTNFEVVSPFYSTKYNELLAIDDTIFLDRYTFIFKDNTFKCKELKDVKLINTVNWLEITTSKFKKPNPLKVITKYNIDKRMYFEDSFFKKVFYPKIFFNVEKQKEIYKIEKAEEFFTQNTNSFNEISLAILSTIKDKKRNSLDGINASFNSYFIHKSPEDKSTTAHLGIHLGYTGMAHYLETKNNIRHRLFDAGLAYKYTIHKNRLSFFANAGIGVFQSYRVLNSDSTRDKFLILNNVPITAQIGFNIKFSTIASFTISYASYQYAKEIEILTRRLYRRNPVLIGLKFDF